MLTPDVEEEEAYFYRRQRLGSQHLETTAVLVVSRPTSGLSHVTGIDPDCTDKVHWHGGIMKR